MRVWGGWVGKYVAGIEGMMKSWTYSRHRKIHRQPHTGVYGSIVNFVVVLNANGVDGGDGSRRLRPRLRLRIFDVGISFDFVVFL